MRRPLPILSVLILAGLALAAVPGCSSLQKGVDGTVAWLDKPAVPATHPAKPGDPPPVTNGDLVTTTTNTVATIFGAGGLASLVTAAGLRILRSASSKDHADTHDKVDQAIDVGQQTLDAIKDVAASLKPAPAAVPAPGLPAVKVVDGVVYAPLAVPGHG